MNLKRLGLAVLVVLVAIMLAGCGVSSSSTADTAQQEQFSLRYNDEAVYLNTPDCIPKKTAKVHFIDVGQADATYIELPNDNDILIDAGNREDGATVVNYLKEQGVDDIELLVATHPHEDHIGGLPAVLDAFYVEKIVSSGHLTDSNISAQFNTKAKAEGTVYQADNKRTYRFLNVTLEVLTGSETWEDTNDYSVVCRLDTGEVEFLFMGDAEVPVEKMLTGALDAEVLKVGHHGSNSSSSASFLAKVKPEVAVISVGEDNSYGHPGSLALQILENARTKVYRTDVNGTVVIETDGKTYDVVSMLQLPMKKASDTPAQPQKTLATSYKGKYIGSSKSNKYHWHGCQYAQNINPQNKIQFYDAADAQKQGYEPCEVCKPD